MITIDDLFEMLLNNNIDLALIGDIELEDESIKWSYDGLGSAPVEMEEHLEDTFETDKETINDFLYDKKIEENFYFGQPEIGETFIASYIYEE